MWHWRFLCMLGSGPGPARWRREIKFPARSCHCKLSVQIAFLLVSFGKLKWDWRRQHAVDGRELCRERLRGAVHFKEISDAQRRVTGIGLVFWGSLEAFECFARRKIRLIPTRLCRMASQPDRCNDDPMTSDANKKAAWRRCATLVD